MAAAETGLTARFSLIDEISDKLQSISRYGEDAMESLEDAGEAAGEAFDGMSSSSATAAQSVDGVATSCDGAASSTDSLTSAQDELARAADATGDAMRDLAKDTEEAEREVKDAGEAFDEAGQSATDAIGGIADMLAAAGITATVKEIAGAVYELADAFSEAESVIVDATGATGAALDDLEESMMSAYEGNYNSLDEVASAIGEINTRMGLTGEELSETTDLFLDFANVTGGTASDSVRTITQLMNQWGVSESEMAGLMDKLTYAGQASGISVSELTSELTSNKAVLDQLGFSLDEATAMFANFEKNGTSATTVMTGFRTALSSGAISSLEDLYDVFDEIAAGELSAADAADIFGSRAGTTIVNAVNNGTLALDDMLDALDSASGTIDTTAEASKTLSDQGTESTNKLKAAFT
ncbi:MAG: phage tail tape measure protein, partial [Prevotellaceae bacterium]|nr:phage tail tape measure protein [Prevotellaceae bacterium]